MSFLQNRHPQWEDKKDRWEFAWDNYSGEYARHDRIDLFKKGKNKKLTSDKYLHRKVQAETLEAYAERILTSDPVLLFPTAVDSLNGIKEQQFLTEDDEVVSEVVGEASVHILDPVSVVDWYPNENPTQVLVKEAADMRSSIMDTDSQRDRDTFILYTLEGWTRYIEVEGNPQEIESGEYEFYETENREVQTLPIFPVELPMPRDIGYLLAMKQNHIYNAKSIRDFSVRNMSFATLVLSATEDQYNQFIQDIAKGYRVIREDPDNSGQHKYISPPSDYLNEAREILSEDKQAFMESAFKTYGDAAKQATATEIRQESRSGVEAFLNLLVTSLDEFENKCLFLLEQVYFSEEPGRWGEASVERSTDFTPKDIEEALNKLSGVVRNASQANAMSTRRKVELLNPDMTEEEIQEEVDRINEERGAVEMPSNFVGG